MPQFDIAVIPSQSIVIFIFFFFYFVFLKYGLTMFCFTRKVYHYVEISYKKKFLLGRLRRMLGHEKRRSSYYLIHQLTILKVFEKFYNSSNRIVPSQLISYPSPIRLYHTSQFKYASVKNVYPTRSKIKEETIVETLAKSRDKSRLEMKSIQKLLRNLKFRPLLVTDKYISSAVFKKLRKKATRNINFPTKVGTLSVSRFSLPELRNNLRAFRNSWIMKIRDDSSYIDIFHHTPMSIATNEVNNDYDYTSSFDYNKGNEVYLLPTKE